MNKKQKTQKNQAGGGGAAEDHAGTSTSDGNGNGGNGNGSAGVAVVEAIVHLRGQDGVQVGPPLKVPTTIKPNNLKVLVNKLLLSSGAAQGDDNLDGVDLGDEHTMRPFTFFIDEVELETDLSTHLAKHGNSLESLQVTFKPEAWFKVLPVSRCSATMTGHSESVLSVNFSPHSRSLASGSGDTTVRIWDLNTQTRMHECKGHKNWVLCVCWSPDAAVIASGDVDGLICLWEPEAGTHLGNMKGHKDSITSLCWEPAHLALPSRRMCSSSKDKSIKVWDVRTRTCLFSMHSHRQAVTCVRWSGEGLIYSSSRDCNIYVWETERGRLIKQLQGHGHWVNTLALSTEHALKTGPYDQKGRRPKEDEKAKQEAMKRFKEACGAGQPERLVSGSDDFTMFLWDPSKSKHPMTRMTGHKNLVNQVQFSPNGQWIASASFDKSVKLWNGNTGTFVTSFFGHVGPVYQIAWSADSRLICSGSKDSTLKLWDVKSKKLKGDLPGHADEVFTVDWCTAGTFVASGGRDHVLKLWRH